MGQLLVCWDRARYRLIEAHLQDVHTIWAVGLVAIAAFVFARMRNGEVVGLSTWARLWFPCWKFFDRPGPVMTLWVREVRPSERGPWIEARLGASRHGAAGLVSPTNALRWARLGLLDQLVAAAGRHTAAPALFSRAPSYRQVQAWAASELPPGTAFEFKLVATSEIGRETLLASTVHRRASKL